MSLPGIPIEMLRRLCDHVASKNLDTIYFQSSPMPFVGPFGQLEKYTVRLSDEVFELWPTYEMDGKTIPARITRCAEWTDEP